LLAKFPFKKPDKKLKLIIDSSNGAASKIAHMVFNDTLFDAQFIYDSPDGKNINDGCGSQHTQELQRLVVTHKSCNGWWSKKMQTLGLHLMEMLTDLSLWMKTATKLQATGCLLSVQNSQKSEEF